MLGGLADMKVADGGDALGCSNLASFTFRVQDDGGMVNGGVDTDATPNRLSFDVTAVNDALAVSSTKLIDQA